MVHACKNYLATLRTIWTHLLKVSSCFCFDRATGQELELSSKQCPCWRPFPGDKILELIHDSDTGVESFHELQKAQKITPEVLYIFHKHGTIYHFNFNFKILPAEETQIVRTLDINYVTTTAHKIICTTKSFFYEDKFPIFHTKNSKEKKINVIIQNKLKNQ